MWRSLEEEGRFGGDGWRDGVVRGLAEKAMAKDEAGDGLSR